MSKEDERLSLWILLTQKEKLDMLAHQMIEQEAQMMAFLLEAEYGAEITLKNTKENLRFKEPLQPTAARPGERTARAGLYLMKDAI